MTRGFILPNKLYHLSRAGNGTLWSPAPRTLTWAVFLQRCSGSFWRWWQRPSCCEGQLNCPFTRKLPWGQHPALLRKCFQLQMLREVWIPWHCQTFRWCLCLVVESWAAPVGALCCLNNNHQNVWIQPGPSTAFGSIGRVFCISFRCVPCPFSSVFPVKELLRAMGPQRKWWPLSSQLHPHLRDGLLWRDQQGPGLHEMSPWSPLLLKGNITAATCPCPTKGPGGSATFEALLPWEEQSGHGWPLGWGSSEGLGFCQAKLELSKKTTCLSTGERNLWIHSRNHTCNKLEKKKKQEIWKKRNCDST